MRIDIFTLFPGMFDGYINESILKRAQEAGHLQLHLHNIRDYTTDKHHVTDSPPYGGGGGMVLRPEPVFAAVDAVRNQAAVERPPLILLTPQGRPFNQRVAEELAGRPHFMLLCGRYEGVDERIRQHLVDDEISIGDFVLTGGELAAMVIVDAVTRLLPDVLGAEDAAASDSFAAGLLEGPHYTRPETFRDRTVPAVLLSGHQANVDRWRRQGALRRTWQRRPELLLTAPLSEEDQWFLKTLAEESAQENRR